MNLRMPFDCLKALCADDMLDAAGVLGGCLRLHPESLQPGGEKRMPLIDPVCDLPSGLGQSDIAFRRDNDMMIFSQFFHCHADAGFFKIKFRRHINGADDRELPAQHEDCFQIIFCGFIHVHKIHLNQICHYSISKKYIINPRRTPNTILKIQRNTKIW